MTQDGPPGRPYLHPVGDEPPFDPDYDRPAGPTPAQDPAAEQAVLGSLLLQPDLAPTLTLELNSTDFYRPQHQTIWDTAHQLITAGTPLDVLTLAAALDRTHQLTKVGGPLYLHELTTAVPTPASAPYYAAIVRDTARLRTVTAAGTKLTQLGLAGDVTKVDAYLSEAVQTLDDAAMRFGPRELTSTTGLANLSWILTGNRPVAVPPRWCRRTDGTALFYAGRHNGIFGDPDSAKTWLAQCAGVEALLEGEQFAMIDVDHNGQEHTAARLALLGAPWELIAEPTRFRYYEPDDADELRAAVLDITREAPAVVVIDSLGEVLPMLGVKSIDNDEITAAIRTICMPPAKAGSCVISIDHLPKGVDARASGYAIGGTSKKRVMDGAYLRAEAKLKPAPGAIGRVMLRIEKDRTGELKRTSGGGYAGTFTLDSSNFDPEASTEQVGTTTWSIGRSESPKNDDGTFRPTNLMEKVATYIAANEGCSGNDIELNIPGKKTWTRQAIQILVAEGFIAREQGPRRSWLHTLLIPYREAEDDHSTPNT